MSEPVRLVIWDLDDTFWHGTLSEGGVRPCMAAIRALRTLAARGIPGSICSKNDAVQARAVLEDWGLWDFFVFPSIDWSHKGPRLAALIEAMGLRASSVLFIDDNETMLREAGHYAPGLQLGGPELAARLLADPRCRGAPDPDRRRLTQYRLLQQRAQERAAQCDGNEAFLRQSGIMVTLDYDVAPQIDRAIELVNRTNQLNFTKRRLPEDPAQARAALGAEMAPFHVHCGLVRVRDHYGDHGVVGFFLQEAQVSNSSLVHFCFSCRVLGMGIETWLYRRLGRPALQVVGEVRGDPVGSTEQIDWIGLGSGGAVADAPGPTLGRVLIHGGCDLESVASYVRPHAAALVGEFNIVRHGLAIRRDLSVFLHYAVTGAHLAAMPALRQLGYLEEDFSSQSASGESDLYVFSFWADAAFPLYQHRDTCIAVPFSVPGLGHHDLVAMPAAKVEARLATPAGLAAYRYLRAEFTCIGLIDEARFTANLQGMLRVLPARARVVISLADEAPPGASGDFAERHARLNRWTRQATVDRPNTVFLALRDLVKEPAESTEINHFGRGVYHRMGQELLMLGDGSGPVFEA